MSKVKCTGKHILIEVEHKGVTYNCVFCDGVKNMYECEPEPQSWNEIVDIVRDAAWNLKIENLDELG